MALIFSEAKPAISAKPRQINPENAAAPGLHCGIFLQIKNSSIITCTQLEMLVDKARPPCLMLQIRDMFIMKFRTTQAIPTRMGVRVSPLA